MPVSACRVLLIVFFVAIAPCSAVAGNITGLPGGMKCADLFNDGTETCALSIEIGKIAPETVDGVRYLITYGQASSRKPLGSMVYLNSLGGNVSAAIAIGRIVREEKLPATVETAARCISACVFVLAGAIRRTIEGAVGIHRPYFPVAVTAKSSDQVVDNYADVLKVARNYLVEVGVAERLLDEMLRIEPDKVRFLTRAELDAFGLGEGPPRVDIEKLASLREAVSLKAAKAYGVSREEYMRRTALIDKTCRLEPYSTPDEPIDFSSFGRTNEQLKMSKSDLLAADLHTEEAGWSHCYRAIMTRGRDAVRAPSPEAPYRRASDSQIMEELTRYCPTGEPPCQRQPPQALLQEAARRGLVTFPPNPALQRPTTTCITIGIITDCE